MANLRARVELRGSLTHQAPATAGGRLMKKGTPVIMTDPSHIQYYRSQAGFSVSMLEQKKAAKPAAPPAGDSGGASGGGGEEGYTEADLKKMKKAELVEIADSMDLETDGATVPELIDGILEAQEED